MIPEHSFPFDPTNGMTCEELLKIKAPEAPADFKSFWEENYNLVMSHVPTYFIEREIWSPDPGVRIYLIRVKNWDNTEFSMWLCRPEESKGGLLIGQGYGNPAVPAEKFDLGLTICHPCVRGLGRSQCKEIPWKASLHVLHGIRSKETYILRGVITDLWMAVSVMIDMFPDTVSNLNYEGASMGGGMGALMLPWDKRFKAAHLAVPTFGSAIRFDYQSTGSGEACRQYVQDHPEALDVLAYFDASVSAQYLNIPVLVTPALFDPCVAPAGQFSVANSIPEKNRILKIREVGHFAPTENDKRLEIEIQNITRSLFLSE
ncbi:MAG: acetylxylan esterase [Lentisphaeria bacterium]|nr:acetylxylan esterase [Lentisphaeria bacterium]